MEDVLIVSTALCAERFRFMASFVDRSSRVGQSSTAINILVNFPFREVNPSSVLALKCGP